MHTFRFLFAAGLAALLLAAPGCSDDKLDEIDTNPNDPLTAGVRQLLPAAEAGLAVGIHGNEAAWFATTFVEHSAGVHAQFEQVDKRVPGSFNNTATNNTWVGIYAALLKDLDTIIRQGSTGREAGAWRYVGIAKVLKVYTLSVATDLYGRVPNTAASQGIANLKPTYDTQQSIYQDMDRLLTEAVADLDKPTTLQPANADFYYGGDPAKWKKLAYALQARLANHLSKRDPQGSATKTLAALAQGLASPADDFTFRSYSTLATGENVWFQERNDRSHFAVSRTIYDIWTGLNDPRRELLTGTLADGTRVPAPNGSSQSDQPGTLYSRASTNLVSATAPQPLLTFAEQKFIEAEAQLRLGSGPAAYAAYQAGVSAALANQGVPAAAAITYLAQASVSPGASALTQENIITQKYLGFYIYGAIEAYNDYRRTGFPALRNTEGPAPRRYPYGQSELDSNRENVPATTSADGVWWDDGTED
ncbi:SusD/RagB family nutrient-binding outer membrane lipoprotein [Hymenobacter sp.]|uniref:SusD/RagB family nutrient-binding outer membrane lipoprotein n=1 Tax=Hymenobacter sp. TaxID=1898978 RepID=UPI00286A6033|nr:SusD/RagB family nutrient-binding outer membrane lipoprotein [Hymenobacter sp.]